MGLTAEDCGLAPSTENKSEGVALGMEGERGDECLEKNGGGNDEDAVKENERKIANLKEREGLLIVN